MIHSGKIKSTFYTFVFVYTVTAAIALYVSPVNLFWDPSLSLKMTDNGFKNIPFNNYQHPSTQNLNKDENEFVTWWSPGQFALPMVIEKGLHVKLNVAIKILTAICLLFAAVGIFKLYDKLLTDSNNQIGLTTIARAALLFTLIQPFFWTNLFTYEGGGLLMLAYCPWFLYWIINKRAIALNLLLLLVFGLIGFFLKSAFTSIFLGALLYLFITAIAAATNSFTKRPDIKKIALTALSLGLVLICYLLILKVSFLSHNRNISDSSQGIRLQVRTFVYPVIAPVFKLVSLDGLNKTIYWLAGILIAVPLYYFLLKSSAISIMYKYAIIGFVGATFVFYWALYLIGVDVSYELRHFTIIAILLTPGVLLLLISNSNLKPVFITIICLYSCFNLYGFGKELGKSIANKSTYTGYSGLALSYPQELINKIHQIDSLNINKGRDIFCFETEEPCIALEVKNNRVLLKDNFINTHFVNVDPTIYHGRNNANIYLVLPTPLSNTDSIKHFSRFDQYKHFDKVYQANGFSIFKSTDIK